MNIKPQYNHVINSKIINSLKTEGMISLKVSLDNIYEMQVQVIQ